MKRQTFLKSFLGALGAVEIIWTDTQIDKIYGTVIYITTFQILTKDKTL